MSDQQHERGLFRQQYRGPDRNEVVTVIDRYGRRLASVSIPDRAKEDRVVTAMRMLLAALDPGPATSGGDASVNSTTTDKGGAEGAPAPGGTGGESETRFGCLVLDREGEYSDTGTRFRVWRFTEDRPEIPARGRAVTDPTGRRRSVDGPPHAVEGDELWERPDALTPWKLKRDGVRIGSPEHWQVRDAFGGDLPPWGDLSAADEPDADKESDSDGDGAELEAYRYVSREKRCGDPFDGDQGAAARQQRHGLYRALKPIPPAGIEAGDVLLYAYDKESRPTVVRGHTRGLDPEEVAELRSYIRENSESYGLVNVVPEFFEAMLGGRENLVGHETEYGFRKKGLTQFLEDRSRWGERLSDFYYRLAVLTPYVEEVSEPIDAPHQEGALFKLISEAGGRMPDRSGGGGRGPGGEP